MKTKPAISHIQGAVLLAMAAGLGSTAVHAQNFSSTTPGSHTASIDTTQFNVMTFTVKGAGGGAGGDDSTKGGAGANGSKVDGLVQVGPPYTAATIVVAGGGMGSIGGAGGGGTGAGHGAGGAGGGAGGAGGGNILSGGGGGGGGASAINIDGTGVWVRAGGGGGGGGGSTAGNAGVNRTGYSGAGMSANTRYNNLNALDLSLSKTVTNPPAVAVALPPLGFTSNCQTPEVGVDGRTQQVVNGHARDGSGGGANGGSYASGVAQVQAFYGQDNFWNSEGGLTGASCYSGAAEGIVLANNAGGLGGALRATGPAPGTASNPGAAGEVVITFSKDPARIPTIGSVDPSTGTVVVVPPSVVPPDRDTPTTPSTVKSYEVTCTAASGAVLTGSGAAPGPITVAGMLPGETYTCTTVAQLQDNTGDTIKTLVSPPVSAVVPPVVQAGDDSASTPPSTPVIIAVGGNDSATGTTIDPTKTVVTTPPGHGTATPNPDGTITYTPAAGFTGTDTFQYQTCNANGVCSAPATVTVTVQAVATNGATPVPSLSQWGVVLLGLLTAAMGFVGMRRRS